jgi:hypothetical protein
MPKEEYNEISQGSVTGQIASMALNPRKDKLKEFTYINRYQATLFPLLDTIICGRKYVLEVAEFLINPDEYKKKAKRNKRPIIPVMPDLASELLYSTAQWQKSLSGKNLEHAADFIIAEIEKEKSDSGMDGLDYRSEDE